FSQTLVDVGYCANFYAQEQEIDYSGVVNSGEDGRTDTVIDTVNFSDCKRSPTNFRESQRII
ncbi:MAG: hypothetical protein WB614_13190, partial [Pseudolabrys sp.]